jgi:glycosyltransferase involved in cell wall biosynthesis
MTKKVSVIIPVYNQKRELLLRSYQSVLDQDYPNIECIIVDDGSTDGTAEYCDGLSKGNDNLIVVHQKNKRQAAARNNGLDHATGDYVFFLDSDDWIEPNTISTLINLIEEYNSQIAVCSCFKQTSEGKIEKDVPLEVQITVLNRFQAFESYVFDTCYCNHSPCDKLYDKALFENERFVEGTYYEDLGSVYKFVSHADTIVYTNTPLYCYYDNLSSTMHKPFSEHEYDKVEFYHEISEFFAKQNDGGVYQAFINELDKLTMYTAIGFVYKAYTHTQTEPIKNRVQDTRQICKQIKGRISFPLRVIKRMIIVNPHLFAVSWKAFCKITKKESI